MVTAFWFPLTVVSCMLIAAISILGYKAYFEPSGRHIQETPIKSSSREEDREDVSNVSEDSEEDRISSIRQPNTHSSSSLALPPLQRMVGKVRIGQLLKWEAISQSTVAIRLQELTMTHGVKLSIVRIRRSKAP